MPEIRFTVFTPTFNRPELLERVYASLRAQTYGAFEWLVVDDGSAHDPSAQIGRWRAAAPFPIRYQAQPHQGKFAAHNTAVALAKGEFFTTLDSDDAVVPHALKRLLFHWDSIPVERRPLYSGVSCLCLDEASKLVGRPYPRDVLDCRHYEIETKFRCEGERWGFHRTAVLRRFLFPAFAGEEFCPEGLVWNRIGREYLVRHVNEPLRVYHRLSSGITPRVRTVLMRSPRSARAYYQECLELDAPMPWKCRRAVNYIRYSRHSGIRLSRMIAGSAAPVLTTLLAPAGYACYAADVLTRMLRPASHPCGKRGGQAC